MARAKTKTKRKAKTAKKRTKKTAVRRRRRAVALPGAPAVPRRRKGESAVGYHDRLSDLIYEANKAGDLDFSEALQKKAGRLAQVHKSIHRGRRGAPKKRRGPGSYPWYQCIGDQEKRYDPKTAREVCGRIRAASRERYPVYWSVRAVARRNPEQQDFVIEVGEDDSGWHYWVLDQRTGGLAALSKKPYSTEGRAFSAAKRAGRAWHEKHYAAKEKGADKNPKGKKGRGKLPSILSRL